MKSELQKAREALSWMESELHSRGLKDETRNQWAADVRNVLNTQQRLIDSLMACATQLDDERPASRCMDNIASDSAWRLLAQLDAGKGGE